MYFTCQCWTTVSGRQNRNLPTHILTIGVCCMIFRSSFTRVVPGHIFFWGCTFGRVYLDLPCIYSHDRWSYRRRFRLSLLCPLSVERYYFPLTSTWTQCALCFTRNMKSIALVPFYYPDFGQLSRLCIMSVCFDHSLMILILVLLHNEECPYEYYRPTSLTQETHTLTLPRTKHKRKNDWKSFHFHRREKIQNC